MPGCNELCRRPNWRHVIDQSESLEEDSLEGREMVVCELRHSLNLSSITTFEGMEGARRHLEEEASMSVTRSNLKLVVGLTGILECFSHRENHLLVGAADLRHRSIENDLWLILEWMKGSRTTAGEHQTSEKLELKGHSQYNVRWDCQVRACHEDCARPLWLRGNQRVAQRRIR